MAALNICIIKIYLFVQQTWKEGVSTLVLSGMDWERCLGLPGVLDSTVWSPASERTDNFYCKIEILKTHFPHKNRPKPMLRHLKMAVAFRLGLGLVGLYLQEMIF